MKWTISEGRGGGELFRSATRFVGCVAHVKKKKKRKET